LYKQLAQHLCSS